MSTGESLLLAAGLLVVIIFLASRFGGRKGSSDGSGDDGYWGSDVGGAGGHDGHVNHGDGSGFYCGHGGGDAGGGGDGGGGH